MRMMQHHNTIRPACLILFIASWWPINSYASDDYKQLCEKAQAATQTIPAMEKLRSAAEDDVTYAEFCMGYLSTTGKASVTQNHARAADWLRQAARKGLSGAQYNLGVLYAKGRGVPKNNEMAAYWYRRAAEQNDPQAQYLLSLFY